MSAVAAAARRAAGAAATLLLVLVAVFLATLLPPRDAVDAITHEESVGAEHEAEIVARFHLDRPWPERFLGWLGDAARGDLGESWRDRRPVAAKIAAVLPVTLALNGLALGLMLLASVPMGTAAALRPGSAWDRLLAVGSFALHSVPVFWAAVLAQHFLAARLGWFPLFGLHSDSAAESGALARGWDALRHVALPAACLAYGSIAYVSRFVRGTLLDQAHAESLRAARARGVGTLGVVVRHGFRSSAVPLLTLAGFLLPRLVGGSVLVEYAFGLPGVGGLFYESLVARDLPVVLGVTLVAAGATLLGILLADAASALADPRTRRGV